VPGPTEFVLRELRKFNAQATFFCIGDNVSKHPWIFRQIIEQGHSIGNHTFNHLKGWSYTVQDYQENVSRCKSELIRQGLTSQSTGVSKIDGLFRPPYGRIKRSQIKALQDYHIVMWDVLSHDYAKEIPRKRCLQGSIRSVRQGSIVVFHDSLKAEKNLTYVLPRFLDHFAQRGYSFKTIPNT